MVETTNDAAMTVVARETLNMPKVVGAPSKQKLKEEDEIFRGFFGAPIGIIVILWNMIVPLINMSGAAPKHVLWALVHLKIYSTANVHRRIVGWPSLVTYRKWTWYILGKIASLKADVIKLDNRFEGFDISSGATCLLSVDGIDCMTNEPWPFDTKWYSQKFNGPGVKYEVGVCIKTGHIVWTNGPFPAGKGDGTICIEGLLNYLAEDEGVEVDAGYKGHPKFKAPVVATSRKDRKEKSVVRGRHEAINGRLKIFNVLVAPFRHLTPRNKMMEKHGICFDAVSVVTQLKFAHGDSTVFSVDYDVAYD
ncbi:unknown protein [Seminavis robusta]|uniref:DDE Tnp4 domain-containing protein n=1 Tax=Seminavis robusta TaxID=568900 RepID=A0A9N8HZJ3_9STRA|nr:unknown protein [Seminavis robusta]|eukprot:Sro2296_g322390.1 n/a (307) ;mRNA; r:14237-15157